jgi:hypothetical protein
VVIQTTVQIDETTADSGKNNGVREEGSAADIVVCQGAGSQKLVLCN